jgi:protein tyrosine phosphatase
MFTININKILLELNTKVSYGENTAQQHRYNRRNSIDLNDPPYYRPSIRFSNIFVQIESEFNNEVISFPASIFHGFIISEGPSRSDDLPKINFFNSLFFHPKLNIQAIIAAGKPDEGQHGYFDYFSSPEQEIATGFRINSEKQDQGKSTISRYKITITKGDQQKTLTLYHISQMPDFGTAELNEADIRLLYDLANSPERSLVAHCAAGIGRSAAIIFAMALYKNREYIFKIGHSEEISNRIFNLLGYLREKRLQAIQTPEQLEQAVRLGIEFCRLEHEQRPTPSTASQSIWQSPSDLEDMPLIQKKEDEDQGCCKCFKP